MPVLFENERPGTYKAHLTTQHIDQLRQLVNRGSAQHAADSGGSRIVCDLENPRVAGVIEMLVQMCDLALSRLGVDDHRPELPDAKRVLGSTSTDLPEEHA